MKRGALRTSHSEVVVVWVPKPMAAALDQAVKLTDSDRSKFLRAAVRERLTRIGVKVMEAEQ